MNKFSPKKLLYKVKNHYNQHCKQVAQNTLSYMILNVSYHRTTKSLRVHYRFAGV